MSDGDDGRIVPYDADVAALDSTVSNLLLYRMDRMRCINRLDAILHLSMPIPPKPTPTLNRYQKRPIFESLVDHVAVAWVLSYS